MCLFVDLGEVGAQPSFTEQGGIPSVTVLLEVVEVHPSVFADVLLFRKLHVGNEAAVCLAVCTSELFVQKEVLYCLGGIEAFFGPVHSKSYDELMKEEIGLDEVIAPTEKKTYRYTETDIKKRFFAKDRMSLLKEVTEV